MADLDNPDSFPFTNDAHRRSIRRRVMRWVSFACLVGSIAALLEVQPMMAIACAVVGAAWMLGAHTLA